MTKWEKEMDAAAIESADKNELDDVRMDIEGYRMVWLAAFEAGARWAHDPAGTVKGE